MTIIAGMLVHGMLIYSGGLAEGQPTIHFGAVSRNSPENDELSVRRCHKLGESVAAKAVELFG